MANLAPKALFDLSGRIALVSGGGTGIGLMIARALGAAGAKVYVAGRRRAVLDEVVSKWDPACGKAVA
jgi:NAD(P)-dependent dehydrogenase (short-subunit alcohol dehydrogenase family)